MFATATTGENLILKIKVLYWLGCAYICIEHVINIERLKQFIISTTKRNRMKKKFILSVSVCIAFFSRAKSREREMSRRKNVIVEQTKQKKWKYFFFFCQVTREVKSDRKEGIKTAAFSLKQQTYDRLMLLINTVLYTTYTHQFKSHDAKIPMTLYSTTLCLVLANIVKCEHFYFYFVLTFCFILFVFLWIF